MSAPHLKNIYQQDTFRPVPDIQAQNSIDQVTKYGRGLFETFANNFKTILRNQPMLEIHSTANNIFNI